MAGSFAVTTSDSAPPAALASIASRVKELVDFNVVGKVLARGDARSDRVLPTEL